MDEKIAEKKAAKKASGPKKDAEKLAESVEDFPGAVKADEDGSGRRATRSRATPSR